jgi:hypothetical protein
MPMPISSVFPPSASTLTFANVKNFAGIIAGMNVNVVWFHVLIVRYFKAG